MKKIGALEAGGTKMVMAVYDTEGNEIIRKTIPTLEPSVTLHAIQSFFKEQEIDALGIGSFGPLDLDPNSPRYGSITSTPKPGWKDCPLLSILTQNGKIPAAIDTDVNAAAIAEVELGIARGFKNAVYVTVGTGIGGGIVMNGQPVHGMLHPEVGHMLIRPLHNDPIPRGVCPYHDGCLEGLAAGPALGKRAGRNGAQIDDDDPVFDVEADYLAQMCVNLILTLSPDKIILGGGVMARPKLYEMVRQKTVEKLGGYVQHRNIIKHIDQYIVAPALYPVSGLIGSWLLGKKALEQGLSGKTE